jgi:hypothetical protein
MVLRWLLLGTLAVAALGNLGFGLAMILRPDELRYGEAILYGHAARILDGQPLYQPIDQAPYSVAAYTPLYYAAAAGLRVLFGPGFGPGRALSFVAGLLAVAVVGCLTWRRTRSRHATLLACLLFLGLGLPGPIPWFGSYKEDVLGVALALGTVAVLDGGTSRRHIWLAAVLAALAMLTKQTLFGPALGGVIWLAATRRRQHAVLFGAIVAVSVVSVCLGLQLSTGAFWENTVLANLNQLTPEALSFNLLLLAVFQTAPLLIAVVYVAPRLRRRPDIAVTDLLTGAWLLAFIPVLGLAKEGADANYWLLLAAFTAVLVALTLHERERGRGGPLRLAIVANAVFALYLIGGQVIRQPSLVRPTAAARAGFERIIDLVRSEPGDVIADPLDVAVLTDHPIVLEPVLYQLLYLDGHWDPTPVVERICRGEIGLLVLGYRLELPDAEAAHKWPRPVLDALRARMTLQEIVPAGLNQRFVYTLDEGATCGTAYG